MLRFILKNNPKLDLKPLVEKSFGIHAKHLEKEGLLTDLNFYNPVFINDVIQKGIQNKDQEILDYFLDDETHLKKMLENNYIVQENFMLVKFFNDFLSIINPQQNNEAFIKKIYKKTHDWCLGDIDDIRSQWIDRMMDHFKKGNIQISAQLNKYCVHSKFISGINLIEDIDWNTYLITNPNRVIIIMDNIYSLGFSSDYAPVNYDRLQSLVCILLNWCKANKKDELFIKVMDDYLLKKNINSEIKINLLLTKYSEHYLKINDTPRAVFRLYAESKDIDIKLFEENNKLHGLKNGNPNIIKKIIKTSLSRTFYKNPLRIKSILDENNGETQEAINNAEKTFELIIPYCSTQEKINLILRYVNNKTYIIPVIKLFLDIINDIPLIEANYIREKIKIKVTKIDHPVIQRWNEDNLVEGLSTYGKYLTTFSNPSEELVIKIINYYNRRIKNGTLNLMDFQLSGKVIGFRLFKINNFENILNVKEYKESIITFFKNLFTVLDGTVKMDLLDNILKLPLNKLNFYSVYPKMDIVQNQLVINAIRKNHLSRLSIFLDSPLMLECINIIKKYQNNMLNNVYYSLKNYIEDPNEILKNFIFNHWDKLNLEYQFTDFSELSLHNVKINVFENFIDLVEKINKEISLEDKITIFKVAVRENYSIMRLMVKKYEELDFTYDSTNRSYKHIIHGKEYFAQKAYEEGNIERLMRILKIRNKYSEEKEVVEKYCPILGTNPNQRIKIHNDHVFSVDGLLGWVDFKKQNICPQCSREFEWESATIVLLDS